MLNWGRFCATPGMDVYLQKRAEMPNVDRILFPNEGRFNFEKRFAESICHRGTRCFPTSGDGALRCCTFIKRNGKLVIVFYDAVPYQRRYHRVPLRGRSMEKIATGIIRRSWR